MSHSIYGADRATHLKIVVVALVCATAVAGVAVAARLAAIGTAETASARSPAGPIVRAAQPVAVSIRTDAPVTR